MQKLGGGGETLANLWEASLSLKRKRLSSAHEIGSSAWFRRGKRLFLTWILIQISHRLISTKDKVPLSLFVNLYERNTGRDCVEIFFLLLSFLSAKRKKNKERGGEGKYVAKKCW